MYDNREGAGLPCVSLDSRRAALFTLALDVTGPRAPILFFRALVAVLDSLLVR